MTLVLMQFGDGSNKEIEVETPADSPLDALEEARIWVKDNAWFELADGSSGLSVSLG